MKKFILHTLTGILNLVILWGSFFIGSIIDFNEWYGFPYVITGVVLFILSTLIHAKIIDLKGK